MNLIDTLKLAAAALHHLYEARYAALHGPGRGYTPEAQHRMMAEARALAPKLRITATWLFRLAAVLVAQEPPLPAGVELPEWPSRTKYGRHVAPPGELADILQAAVESGDDDLRYGEEFRAWWRDYAILCDELDLKRPEGMGVAELEAEQLALKTAPDAFVERIQVRTRSAGVEVAGALGS